MKITNTENMVQKKVCITYDSMEQLLSRQESITKTLQGYLDRNNNEQYISDYTISINDSKYILTFFLDQTK